MGRSSTKKAAANAALAEYAKLLKRRELLQMQGKVPWSGDLDALPCICNNSRRFRSFAYSAKAAFAAAFLVLERPIRKTSFPMDLERT